MALIVETGTASATAESYASVAEADAYWTARNDVTWVDLDVEQKEACLRKATQHMIQTYRMRWLGYRRNQTQALDWPRTYVPAADVYAYGVAYLTDTMIPVEVKNACIELAYRANSAALLPDQERTAVSETVGPISVTYDRGGPVRTEFHAVDAMLSPYLSGSGTMVALARV